jgi:hypothetical protein
MKRQFLLLIMMLIMALHASAQSDVTVDQTLPLMTENYYSHVTYLKQDYSYELTNKKRALKKRSFDVLMLGVVCGIAGAAGTIYVAEENGWSLAVSLPLEMAVLLGVTYPFSAWSSHLSKKANAIQVESAYVLPIGNHSDLGAVYFYDKNRPNYHAIGIGLKTSF